MTPQPRLTFLLDTNELIPLEPFGTAPESGVARLLARALQYGHRVVVHPANRDDLEENPNEQERTQKLAALAKYEMLEEIAISDELADRAGASEPGTNDHRDLRLLAAVDGGAATYLVTEDRRLRSRSARAGMSQSVPNLAGALELLDTLHPRDAEPPPTVELITSYLIDIGQPIFDSLRDDYEGFDEWFRQKVATDAPNRRCWVVKAQDGSYDAVAIVKVRDRDPDSPADDATKIATFKVASHRSGDKVGELLLRTVLEWAASQPTVDKLFVEVSLSADKESLHRFLETFGFVRSAASLRPNGDATFVKSLQQSTAPDDLDPFSFHVRYGPPAIRVDAPAYIIPIQPHWYFGLFPDSPAFGRFGGVTLGDDVAPATPFGNAIRKAYLCRSPTRAIEPGATLYFYRSAPAGQGRGGGSIQAIGVAERSMRASDSERVLSFVGRRTVYSASDVAGLCDGGRREVLATLFRHDHYSAEPIGLAALMTHNVLRGAPQSITRIAPGEASRWLSQRAASR